MGTETQALVPLDDREVMPLEPKDAAALIIVGRVFDWMAETGNWNLTRAFRATGVDYWSFYRAFKRPVVQGIVTDRLLGQQAATAMILDEYWLKVLKNMADIASGARGNDRDAVQAARFINQVRRELEVQVQAQSQTQAAEEKSPAAALLERFRSRPRTARTLQILSTEET